MEHRNKLTGTSLLITIYFISMSQYYIYLIYLIYLIILIIYLF